MSELVAKLESAQQRAMSIRPEVGGFLYYAEALRQSGVLTNVWQLPSCQSIYFFAEGAVVQVGQPLATQISEVPRFNEAKLIEALRINQAGQSTFPEFLVAAWEAGVISYGVNFTERVCTYFGAVDEIYLENYAAVEI